MQLLSRVAIFNLGFDGTSDFDAHWYYVPDSDFVFYRVGQYNAIRGEDRMNLYVEIGLGKDAHVDLAELKCCVLADLERMGFIRCQKLVACWQTIIDPAYAHITTHSFLAKFFK